MGTLGGGNGGERPPEGGGHSDGLPGLPPEWGTIVIPDDPAELADEVAQVQRELRRESRRSRWRRRFGLPARPGSDEPSIGLPLLIMAIAVVATLTSLFAVAWPKPQREVSSPAEHKTATQLPDVTLADGTGSAVRVRFLAPAVFVLVEGCDCGALVTDTAAATGPGVTVVPVAKRVPAFAPDHRSSGSIKVRPLADEKDALRTALALPSPTGAASVALVSRTGEVIRLVPAARAVDEFRADLARLT